MLEIIIWSNKQCIRTPFLNFPWDPFLFDSAITVQYSIRNYSEKIIEIQSIKIKYNSAVDGSSNSSSNWSTVSVRHLKGLLLAAFINIWEKKYGKSNKASIYVKKKVPL